MKTTEELKNEFTTLVLENIHREGVQELLDELETTDFYRAPASTKYHGCYAGGLVDHSINVYYALLDELQLIYGPGWESKHSLESVAIVSLFHDLCKIGMYKTGFKNVKDKETGCWCEKQVFEYDDSYTPMGHGSKSMYLVMKHLTLTEDEASAIYWHMGAYDQGNYNTVGNLSKNWDKNILGFALFRADMMATYVIENEHFVPLPFESNSPKSSDIDAD